MLLQWAERQHANVGKVIVLGAVVVVLGMDQASATALVPVLGADRRSNRRWTLLQLLPFLITESPVRQTDCTLNEC